MKKSLWIFVLAAVAMAACKKDPVEQTTTDPEEVVIKATAEIFAGAGSTEGLDYVWEAGVDKIGVFAYSAGVQDQANAYYTAYSALAESRFTTSSKIYWGSGARDIYAYYPYRASATDHTAIPVSIAAGQSGPAGGTSHLKPAAVMYASCKNAVKDDGDISLSFNGVFGVLELKIAATKVADEVSSLTVTSKTGETMAFGEGTLDITDGTLSITEETASDNIVFTPNSSLSFSTTATSIYIVVYPGHAGKSLDVSAVIYGQAAELGTITIPSEGIAAGSITSVSLQFTPPNKPKDPAAASPADAIDLSAAGTANTYLVNAAGKTYKFKGDVKGNGEARTYAWTAEGVGLEASYTAADLAIEPSSAALVWHNSPKPASGWTTESPVVISSVTWHSDDYVSFKTPDTFVPGNALLAVFDDAGEVLWSWNIWAVEDYDYEATAKTVGRYTMMDRNLGAIKGKEAMTLDSREAAWAIGNYYQWGRKDPFPAATDYGNGENDNIGSGSRVMEWGLPTYTPIDELKKDCSSEDWGEDNMMFSYTYSQNAYGMAKDHGATFTIDQAVASSVKYPYKWMSSGTDNNNVFPYLWMVQNGSQPTGKLTAWRYLWGCVEGYGSQKSIYDPCPAGWKVPPVDVYNYALTNTTALTYGKYSEKYDLYFPFAGQRQAGFGGSKISGMLTSMFLTSATVTGPYYVWKGNEGDNGISPWDAYVGAGMQMRCVKENVATTMAPTGDQAGPRAVLMGNSITEQWPGRGRAAFFTENNYIGKGISGHTTQRMIARFYTDVLALDPQCVVIAGGTNDIAENDSFGVCVEDVFNNINIMAQLAKEQGAAVVIGACAPAGDDDFFWKDAAWTPIYSNPCQRVMTLNTMLKAYAEREGFLFADYHAVLKDDENRLKLEYSWTADDRIHPNAAGYLVMEPVLKAAVDAALFNADEVDTGGGQLEDLDKWEWQ